MQALLDLFIKVKQAETGVLRIHRKNAIFTYGYTESYKQALTHFVNKLTDFLKSISPLNLSLSEWNQLHLLLFEARRCQLPGEDWIWYLHEIKNQAAGIFQAELAAQKDLAGILDLFDSISVQQPHGKAHILHLERKNILHSYGDTNTYKQALLELAKKAADVAFIISADQAEKEMQIQLLKQLKENVQAVKSYFNKEWQAVIDKLEQKLLQASLITENLTSASHAAVLRLVD